MPTNEIQRFNDAVAGDAGLQARIEAAHTGKELVAIARESGFDVSANDLEQFARSLAVGELSPEKLDRVTGGLSGTDLGSGRVMDSPRPRGLAQRLLTSTGTLDENLLKSF